MPADVTPVPLSPADFEYVRALVRARSAIVINPDQGYLVESRLSAVARREGFASVGQLVAGLRSGGGVDLQVRVVEAMTTNETSFFRDVHPFENLRLSVIPELVRRRAATRRLTIWCGACSTGQEPYSLVMLLREHFPALASWHVQILATDLSEEILTRARHGRFTQLEVNRGLPAALLAKYFTKDGPEWQIRDEVRAAVRFEQLNLTGPWRPFPPMDLVLLRNVLIYFDTTVKKQILGRVRGVMQPDGFLLLGGAESTLNLDDAFERAETGRSGYYRIRPQTQS